MPYKDPEKRRQCDRQRIADLADSYVRKKLVRLGALAPSRESVEGYRNLLRLVRKLREVKRKMRSMGISTRWRPLRHA
ncbi:MAG: hypothetical protein ABSF77_18570 [Spirochaetia bacterium]|jgi:hypothetical protein